MPDQRGRGPGDTLHDEHEPTEQVPAIAHAAPLAGDPGHAARASMMPSEAHADRTEVVPAIARAGDSVHPVFVSMKPPAAHADRTDVVPAIERPDMRPRLRPVSELPLRHPTPIPLGHYAPPRLQGKRSWLWLYVALTMAAALAGAGIALWIRAAW